MNRFTYSLVLAAAPFITLPLSPVAQAACPSGYASNGDCVNEAMLVAAVQAAVIYSQPKISLTAYPVLPSLDRRFRYPHELNPNVQSPTRVGRGPSATLPPPPPPPPPPPGD